MRMCPEGNEKEKGEEIFPIYMLSRNSFAKVDNLALIERCRFLRREQNELHNVRNNFCTLFQ